MGWFLFVFLLFVYSLFCVMCSVLVQLWQGFVSQRCMKAIGIPSCHPTHSGVFEIFDTHECTFSYKFCFIRTINTLG